MAASLWLLEAKAFQQEDRSEAARSVHFWLRPGGYVVGRQGADIVVEEDKSISRRHAELTVPRAVQGGDPHIVVKDISKYGTYVDEATDGTATFKSPPLGQGASASLVPGSMVRFGHHSPFRLYQQDWVLFLSPQHREEAGASTLQALQQAADDAGLLLADELPDQDGTRVLALAGRPLRVDETTLLALLRGYPVVDTDWLLEWGEQKVWRNARPQEASYPVKLQYADAAGRTRGLPGPAALLAARDRAALAGRTLLWLPHARGSGALQAAAGLLGAASVDVAQHGRAPAAAKAEGAVLVRGGAEEAVPAAYRGLPWTTPQLLLAGMLEGDVETAVHLPAGEPDTTPASAATRSGGKGRGKKGVAGGSTIGSGKGRGRGRGGGKGKAEAAKDEAVHLSGSETDVTDDEMGQLRGRQRQLALDSAAKPAAKPAAAKASAGEAADAGAEGRHTEGEAPAAAAPAAHPGSPKQRGRKAAAGSAAEKPVVHTGRKRRQPDAQQQQEQQQQGQQQQDQHGEAVQPSAAKRRRRAVPAAAAGQKPAHPVAMPAAEGWHSSAHSEKPPLQRQQEEQDGGATGASPASAAAPAARGQPRRRAAAPGPTSELEGDRGSPADQEPGSSVPAAAPAAGAAEAPEAAAAVDDGDGLAGVVEEEGASLVAYMPLVRPAAALPTARISGSRGSHAGGGGINFKAFSKGGRGGLAGSAAPPRVLVAFDPEPYQEAAVNADAFMKAEAERRRRLKAADELFAANVKARKAPQLPDPDDDSSPKGGRGGGRGRGSKKTAAVPDLGQQSMLSFLPGAGRGRGRGRGSKAKA
ncbi:hypothetical protein ABPG77_011284 [Micractinium sp. CCAP 211/92]